MGHVVEDGVPSSELTDGLELTTSAGTTLTIGVDDDGTVTVAAPDGGSVATVTIADIFICDTVIHVIDTVLVAGDGAAPEVPPVVDEEYEYEPYIPVEETYVPYEYEYYIAVEETYVPYEEPVEPAPPAGGYGGELPIGYGDELPAAYGGELPAAYGGELPAVYGDAGFALDAVEAVPDDAYGESTVDEEAPAEEDDGASTAAAGTIVAGAVAAAGVAALAGVAVVVARHRAGAAALAPSAAV